MKPEQSRDSGGRFVALDMNAGIRAAWRGGFRSVDLFPGGQASGEQPEAGTPRPVAAAGITGGAAGFLPDATPPPPPDMNELLAEAAGVVRR